jgi:glycosyltransferase involved in cell wall biosynthesis
MAAGEIDAPAAPRPDGARRVRVAWLFTTFPVVTETPSQREIRILRAQPLDLSLHSLWGGADEFEGLPVQRFPKWQLAALSWWLPYWLVRRPGVFVQLAKRLGETRPRSWLNVGETLIGLGFALCHAARFSRSSLRPDLIHAAWATMPATAAQLIGALAGVPFSLGAHAYDVFMNGGDWLLSGKLRDARLIVTSSESTRSRLLERGAPPAKTVMIRRGLDRFPALAPIRTPRSRLRILCVGRLVEKKGYHEQLAIYARMRAEEFTFEARLIGGGPLEGALRARIDALGLAGSVALLGAMPHAAVERHYEWADVLLYTGKVAANGDRDGLPNVILEAMAAGVPVASSPVAAIPEVLRDGANALLLPDFEPERWVRALERLRDDDALYDRIRREARATVERDFDVHINARALLDRLIAIANPSAGRPAESVHGVRAG